MRNVPSYPIQIAEGVERQAVEMPGVLASGLMDAGAPDREMANAAASVIEFAQSMVPFLRGHEHFFVDDPVPFINTDFRGLDLSECRFPFETTGLMYQYDPESFGMDISEIPADRQQLDRERFVIAIDLDSHDAITIISFFKHDPGTPPEVGTPGTWSMTPVSGTIPRELLKDASKIIRNKEAHFIIGSPIPGIDTDRYFESAEAFGVSRTELADTLADDIRVAIGFLAISSAKNVPIERLPAPERLNKKRAKRGKAPLPGYHVLDLSFGRRVSSGDGTGRTHASPRLHTRRGHMRQCASGVITYVRPTLVGDPTKGAVEKDYRVRRTTP